MPVKVIVYNNFYIYMVKYIGIYIEGRIDNLLKEKVLIVR